MIALLVIILAASTPHTAGVPVTDTTTAEDVIDCYLGMDPEIYRCVPDDDKNYLHCNIEAKRKCNCVEGLVCRRDIYFKEEAYEEQCAFQCVIEDPRARGMKNIQEWNENMERIFK